MNHFEYKNNELYCEDVSIAELVKDVGTPAYIYSHATMTRHFEAFDQAFQDIPHITCYSVKSNSNIAVLKLFASMGAGVDIVSGGELFRALKAGVPSDKIVYSGVGKTREEMQAALEADILMFNVESDQEISVLAEEAQSAGKIARIALRVNPDVDAKTHPYISTGLKKNKFGVPIDQAFDVYLKASKTPGLEVVGVDFHIGSQLTETAPFVDAIKRLRLLIDRLTEAGVALKYLDLGGGLGITYSDEEPPAPNDYAIAVKKAVQGLGLIVILEPGRVIMGNAGIFVASVLFTKTGDEKTFTITDGGMNDLIRPSLYDSYHAVQGVTQSRSEPIKMDVVGPICESSDFLAKDRMLPAFKSGDLIAVMSAGAYGFTMSSNYNSRPRAVEILVKGAEYYTIRQRETIENLVQGEQWPSFLESE